jgi:putative two-component system response regulator
MLRRLAMAGEYHDEDTYLHTDRVGASAARIAQAYGAPRDFVRLIRLAATLHDLGKLAVPDTILLTRGPLTGADWEQVRTHPVVGAAILAGSTSEVLQLAEEIALTHHEWWDGSGYPAGLRGKRIPLSGRIVTLADTFDALTHDRPYKAAWSIERAIAEIQRLCGSKFDPEVVRAFNRVDPVQLVREPTAPVLAVPPHVRSRPAIVKPFDRRASAASA